MGQLFCHHYHWTIASEGDGFEQQVAVRKKLQGNVQKMGVVITHKNVYDPFSN